jgi:hypothetical protein
MRSIILIGIYLLLISSALAQDPAITIPYTDVAAREEFGGWFVPAQGMSNFYGAAFSPDNSRLALWTDGYVYIYNVATQQTEAVINAMIDYPESVAWNADGTLLWLQNGLYDVEAKSWLNTNDSILNVWSSQNPSHYFAENQIWRLGTADPLRTFKGVPLAVTPDLSHILTAVYEGENVTLRVRDIPNRVDLGTYTFSQTDLALIAPPEFSPTLTRALLGECCTAHVIDLPSSQEILTIHLQDEPTFDPDSGGLMPPPDMESGGCGSQGFEPGWSADSSKLFYKDTVYDLNSGAALFTLPTSTVAAWTNDGARLMTSDGVWDGSTGQPLFALSSAHDLVQWNEAAQRILGWSARENRVTIWDASGNVLLQADHSGEDNRWCGGASPMPPTWSADGHWLATWGYMPLRLAVGSNATIMSQNDTLNMRAEPSTETEILEKLLPQTEVTLVDGPQQGSGYTWWRVQLVDGREGWVVESADGISTLYPRGTRAGAIQIWHLP